jgi:cytochrome c biogenesis protein CcdA
LSLWGQEIAPQEASMAAQQTSPHRLKSIAGAILLALGFLILFVNLDAVAGQIANTTSTPEEPFVGMLTALVLAMMRAVQSYAFDHAGFLSSLLQILVSFWPLILIVAGAILLRRGASMRQQLSVERSTAWSRGDR